MEFNTKLKTNLKGVFILLCIAILTAPLNIKIISALRISDIFLTISLFIFCLSNPKIKYPYFIFSSIFLVTLLLSSYFSIFTSDKLKIEGIFFYYKYSLIIIIPWMITTIINTKFRLNIIINILYFNFVFLVVWAFLYSYFRYVGIIVGHPRVSFPFTDYTQPDAHVYSSYISFTLIGYIEYMRKILNHKFLKSLIIFILSFIALFLSGSKTGILLISIYFLFILLRFFNKKSKKDLILILVTFISTYYAFLYFSSLKTTNEEIYKLFFRTVKYDFLESTIRTRLLNFFQALKEISSNYGFLGSGPTSASQIFYDGGISIILTHSGIIGLLVLIFLIYLFCLKAKFMSKITNTLSIYKTFLFLIFIYSTLCIITEHFLITRNFLPVATLLSTMYAEMIFGNSNNSKEFKDFNKN